MECVAGLLLPVYGADKLPVAGRPASVPAVPEASAKLTGQWAGKPSALGVQVAALPEASSPAQLKKAVLRLALEQAEYCVLADQIQRSDELVADVQATLPRQLARLSPA